MVKIEVSVVGPLAPRVKGTVIEDPREELSIKDVLSLLRDKYSILFENDEPGPGVLVFINGRDYRVYTQSDKFKGKLEVVIMRVFHGGKP